MKQIKKLNSEKIKNENENNFKKVKSKSINDNNENFNNIENIMLNLTESDREEFKNHNEKIDKDE